MVDGSAPPKSVGIEYYCPGKTVTVVAITGKNGDYHWNYAGLAFGNSVDSTNASTIFAMSGASAGAQALTIESGFDAGRVTSSSGYEAQAFAQTQTLGTIGCILRARSTGLVSSVIDLSDRRLTRNPQLPDIVLSRAAANEGLEMDAASKVPKAAQKEWSGGFDALRKRNWEEARQHLRAAVEAAPGFALGWSALALAYHNLQQPAESRDALQHAIGLDPKSLSFRFRLMRTEMDVKDWNAAAAAAAALTEADAGRHYPDAYLDQAVIQYHLNDLDKALADAAEEVHRDARHELPRAEYILGLIYEARKEYPAADEHMRRYLELAPKAPDAETVRARIANLGKPTASDIASALDGADVQLAAEGQAWVPGGIKALAALAGLKPTTDYSNFFQEFCQAVAEQAFPEDGKQMPGYYSRLQAFMSAAVELAALGERRGDTAVVTLSLADDAARRRTERALALVGWKLARREGEIAVEPGDQELDGLRQGSLPALGIDAIAMKRDLEAGRSFRFEVPSDNARLLGGAAWGVLLLGQPALPGGLAEVFTRDWRFAAAYAGLSTMSSEAATAVVTGVGLRSAVTRHADLLWRYAEAFAVSKGAAVVPGGAPGEPVWAKLAGASPQSAPAFFRALLEKDSGNLASFYYELSRADAAHQRFFTADPQRAARFYAWYRASGEVHRGQVRKVGAWRSNVFRDLPLDDAGRLRFPGGRPAWTASQGPDDDVPLRLDSLEALVPMARIEKRRGVPLDEDSASLLVHHYAQWQHLFPYFEELPGLGKADFQALEAFGKAIAASPPAKRNELLGIWHSLVELTVLAVRAGSLDSAAAARAFRGASEAPAAPDYPVRAIEVLRQVAGPGPGLEDAVAGKLRLSDARRAAFDRVLALQSAPRIDSLPRAPDGARLAAALSGLVYAALLGPDWLVVSEDPLLVSKHRFVQPADTAPLFPASDVTLSSTAPGSYFTGGFMQFQERAQVLARADEPAEISRGGAAAAGGRHSDEGTDTGVMPTQAVFRADARMVEVYATVTDGRGRHVDDLGRDEFAITEDGQEVLPAAFEDRASAVSCVLLLDNTGSMQAALPALRASALRLIGELRPIDSMAVYSFSDSVTVLQPFTTDKDAAARAVLRTQAFGKTALYDALVRVTRDLAGRAGKKVIVVFTDGADNQSALTSDIAMRRAKTLGVPLYTIAQGDALESPDLLKQLAAVAKATGGAAFAIHSPSEIPAVFDRVSQDLTHGYLFAFQPPARKERGWRSIEVRLRTPRGRKIRAREGYYAD